MAASDFTDPPSEGTYLPLPFPFPFALVTEAKLSDDAYPSCDSWVDWEGLVSDADAEITPQSLVRRAYKFLSELLT